MKVFNGFNQSGAACPICDTRENKKTVLCEIDTQRKDGIAETAQIHLECIRLQWAPGISMLFQIVHEKELVGPRS